MAPALVVALIFAVPGVRLAMLARRTGELPERLLAVFFCGFAIGVPIRLVTAARLLPGEWMRPVLAVDFAILLTAAMGLIAFCWKVFRPDSRGAKLATFAIGALLSVALVVGTANGSLVRSDAPLARLANVCVVFAFGWVFFECLRHARLMRRRRTLGLADPVVANRFSLWCVWTGGFVLLPVIALVARLTMASMGANLDMSAEQDAQTAAAIETVIPVVQAAIGIVAFVSSVAIWLSFFPPARYLRRIRAAENA